MLQNPIKARCFPGSASLAAVAGCWALLLVTAWPVQAATILTTDTVLSGDLFDSVVIGADDITLDCNGHAVIGIPASTGIVLNSRSGVTIQNCTVTGFLTGIQVRGAASVELIDTIVEGNVLHGLEVSDNASVSITGAFTARENGVFGVLLINNARARLVGATVTLEENTAGLQVSLNSSLFVDALPPNPPSTLTARDHAAFGLTVVSKSHLFLFGDAHVMTRDNGSNGLSIFSRSAVELDNGPTIIAEDNAVNGILLEDSTLNLFNMPQFPGATVTLRDNGAVGLNVAKASVFDIGGDATVLIEDNPVGLRLDDGSTARVRGSIIVDNGQDVALTFAARGDFAGNTIGSLSCDHTVLIRGDEQCPDDDDDDDD